ncbi:hypothetical protein CSOJ01_10764 [Colletotrichum sojae]|uniref:Uncharacterized protein n=1 Tax=Colletotrichum sojae TaxID=2175907 RepID=A0A8H6J004_9PEZI|nr:hypothetical protein CSOJ01_10764 [Colletotrichum sojae]
MTWQRPRRQQISRHSKQTVRLEGAALSSHKHDALMAAGDGSFQVSQRESPSTTTTTPPPAVSSFEMGLVGSDQCRPFAGRGRYYFQVPTKAWTPDNDMAIVRPFGMAWGPGTPSLGGQRAKGLFSLAVPSIVVESDDGERLIPSWAEIIPLPQTAGWPSRVASRSRRSPSSHNHDHGYDGLPTASPTQNSGCRNLDDILTT